MRKFAIVITAMLACNTMTYGMTMEFVSISDAGFTGQMAKYETTNAQYCEFLNDAYTSSDITVGANNIVYGASGDFAGQIYFDTYPADIDSQITFSDGVFDVRSREGYDMINHPVVEVSWYGAAAFADYYGWRLPTEWEWEAVADFDGTYTYGCGITIDQDKANYDYANPLGLTDEPYTSPVDHYSSYGYGMNDMAGNVWEWTSSIYDSDGEYVLRGGSYATVAPNCTVTTRDHNPADATSINVGFRVVPEPATLLLLGLGGLFLRRRTREF
ncbi:MAG: SUMF1/EgtB/PvdO family nonheme iron enzyme [Phycisphaerales bacterium]|jgi:formylglycine-generating enzyme required for sulfatase activity